MNGIAPLLAADFGEPGFVVRARGTCLQPNPGDIAFLFRGFAHIHAERNSCTGQQGTHASQLVLGQSVHRIDQDGADACCCVFVFEIQAPADDWVQKTLGLTGTGPRRYQCCSSGPNRTDGIFLVSPNMGDVDGNTLAHMRMKELLGNEISH